MSQNDAEVGKETGASTPPGAEVSQPETSPSSVDVDAIAKALGPMIADTVAKQVQSFKDKRFDQLGQQVSGFSEQLARLRTKMETGLSEQQALHEMSLEDRLAVLEQGLQPTGTPQAQPAGTGENKVAVTETAQAVLKALGINENSPEVTKIFSENSTLEGQLNAIVALKSGNAKAPEPNPAGVQPSGGGGSAYQDAEAIAAELEVLYGMQSTKEVEAKIATLIDELDKQIPKQ